MSELTTAEGPKLALTPETREPRALLAFLAFLQKHLPRGRGAIPRMIGAKLAEGLSHHLTTRHGAKLCLSSSSYDVYATMAQTGNAWDYEDFRICLDSISETGVFFEIGANVGYFAVEAANLRRNARVYAFEPQSDLAGAIERSARLNNFGNLTVIDALVGDSEGDRILYLAAATIHASAVEDSGRKPLSSVPKVMITIDGMVTRGDLPAPTFVKMDVEGSEALVFRGAAQAFRKHCPNIFLEYLPEFDVDNRIRGEVMALVSDVPDYKLYGIPSMNKRASHPKLLIPIDEIGWADVHGLYILNQSMSLPNPDLLDRRATLRP